MELLSLAASVIAVIQITESVVKICKQYVGGVKDAPAELRLILIEASALKGILEPLQILLDSPGQYIKNDSLKAPIEECRRAVGELESLLGDANGAAATGGRSKRRKRAITLESLAWPLKRSRAMKLVEELGLHKRTIGLILEANTAASVRGLVEEVEEVKQSMTVVEQNEILRWLISVDPSSNHRQACDLHDELTTRWITATPEWQNWVAGNFNLLWLFGIPGAGKTILTSSVIQRLSERQAGSKPWEKEACVYYYCYHARDDKHDDVESFLGWVTSQLCRQAAFVPDEIRGSHSLNSFPSAAEYLRPLRLVCQKFSRVYLVVDALDESQSRRKLLSFLQRLSLDKKFDNLYMFVTSRDEIDIRSALDPISTSISMSNSFVDRDIATYIENELCSNAKFSKWPLDLRERVQYALSSKAKGMFRWAACQLTILQRLNKRSTVLEAIESLPGTLDETYERILCSIPAESMKIAHRALQLLCSDLDAYSAEHLMEAVFWGDEESRYPEDQLFGVESLQEICICLVTVSPYLSEMNPPGHLPKITGRTIQLAHYTVREYLEASRIQGGPASYFHLSDKTANQFAFNAVLRTLIRSCDSNSPPLNSWFDFCWNVLPQMALGGAGLMVPISSEMLFSLLDPRNDFLTRGARGPLFGADERYVDGGLPLVPLSHYDSPDDEGPAVVVARLYILGLEELVQHYLLSLAPATCRSVIGARISFDIFHDCSLLDITIASGSLRWELLFQHGHRLEASSATLFYLARADDLERLAIGVTWGLSERPDILDYLLDQGADPNGQSLPLTPLQVACFSQSWKAARLLLRAGADARRVGDGHLRSAAMSGSFQLQRHLKPVQIYWRDRESVDQGMLEELDSLFGVPDAEAL